MSNIIFLDIDGVLNSKFWNENNQREINNGTLIDIEKVRLLKNIVSDTKAKIILHSGWRFWFDEELKPIRLEAERLIEIFTAEGLKIDGFTPDLTTEEIRMTQKFSLVKAKEILCWLAEHKNVNNWVVIEDLDLNNKLIEEHQIKTDNSIGLSSENVKEVINFLRT